MIPSFKNRERTRKPLKLQKVQFYKMFEKQRFLPFFKLVHKTEVCLNKVVQKGQTSTSHHNHIINLKLHQLLKVYLFPHMQTELLPSYK